MRLRWVYITGGLVVVACPGVSQLRAKAKRYHHAPRRAATYIHTHTVCLCPGEISDGVF